MKETNNEETVKKRTNKNVLIGCLGLIMAGISQKHSESTIYQRSLNTRL